MAHAATPFTGRKMLLSVVAFFGVVIAANLTMMGFALSTHTGVVVPNSYVASQDFNDRIADAAAQRARGWRAAFAYENGEAVVEFVDRDGAPITGLDLAGAIGRPVTEAEDRTLGFRETSPGRYAATVDLAAGEWRLDATAASATGETHRLIRELFVAGAAG